MSHLLITIVNLLKKKPLGKAEISFLTTFKFQNTLIFVRYLLIAKFLERLKIYNKKLMIQPFVPRFFTFFKASLLFSS